MPPAKKKKAIPDSELTPRQYDNRYSMRFWRERYEHYKALGDDVGASNALTHLHWHEDNQHVYDEQAPQERLMLAKLKVDSDYEGVKDVRYDKTLF